MLQRENIPAKSQAHIVPRVHIIILNYNNYADTSACIQSVEKIDYPRYSIVIVDNASSDGSNKKLREEYPRHIFVQSTSNGGYAAGNNLGIKIALEQGTDYIMILNNDTILSTESLRTMVDSLQSDTTAGMATCKIFYDRTKKHYPSAGNINKLLCAIVPLRNYDDENIQEVSYVAGCALVVKSSVFQKVGLLNEKFFMYFEDVEFSMRVGQYYRLLYVPHVAINHKSGGGDQWHNYSAFYLYYSSRNRVLTFGHSPLSKMHVSATNLANIGMKIVVLLLHTLFGTSVDLRSKVRALFKGAIDGIRGDGGRNLSY